MDEAAVYLQQIQTMSEFLDGQIEEIPDYLFHRRPGPGLNPVSWNYFHMLRTWDVDLNWNAKGQSSDSDGWHRGEFTEKAAYEPLGQGGRELGIGFGYSNAEVDELTMGAPVLSEYHHLLLTETIEYLKSADDDELHREIKHSSQPDSTPAKHIQHSIGHCWNHIGEIRYIKGMLGMPDPSYPGE